MNIAKISKILKTDGVCVVCKDSHGVQWIGGYAAIYPARGWGELDNDQISEMFDNGPHDSYFDIKRENDFPFKGKNGKKCELFDLLKFEADAGEIIVPVKMSHGIVFIKDKYLQAIDGYGARNFYPVEYKTALGKPIIAFEDAEGNKCGAFSPYLVDKRIVKALRAIGLSHFLTQKKAQQKGWME